MAAVSVSELPLVAVKVLRHQILAWGFLGHIQRREAFFGVLSEDRESAVGASVRCCEDLGEETDGACRLSRRSFLVFVIKRIAALRRLREECNLRINFVCVCFSAEYAIDDAAEYVRGQAGVWKLLAATLMR